MSDAALEKNDGQGVTNEHHIEDSVSEKILEHDNVHINNELAYKGDDSDGKVDWPVRSIIAATGLGCLYTGMYIPCPMCTGNPLTLLRISGPASLRRRQSELH